MRKKWLVTLVALTMALAAITGGGYALAGDGTDAPEVFEPSGDEPTATSIDDIDPNVCNPVHNIDACTQEELEELGLVGPATMRGPFPFVAPITGQGSDNPEVGLGESCNLAAISWIVDPGTAEGPEDLGVVTHGDPTYEQWLSNYALPEDKSGSTLVSTQDEGGGIEPGCEVEDSPEPLFVDGEPQYHQSLNDAIVEDCGLAGGTAYVTSDGEVGCVVARDVEDSGKELVSSSQPPTIEPQSTPTTK